MGRRSKKQNELGDVILGFSHFSSDFEEERRKAKIEFEAKIKALDSKRREQKQQYDVKADEYRKIYTDTIMRFAPEIFCRFGMKLEADLGVILADSAKVEQLNKSGDYNILFTKEVSIFEAFLEFLDNREDVLDEITAFINKKYVELGYERDSG